MASRSGSILASPEDGSEDELSNIRYLFRILFVRNIIQLVNGEEQIWMVETGPQNRVHIWAALGPDDDDEDNIDADEESQEEDEEE